MSPQSTDKRNDARIAALPLWQGRPRWQPLKGGLSNESFLVEDAAGRHVVRFCEDFSCHQVSRQRELAAARAAHAAGFAPEIVHAGPGVMVSRFIEGRTYDAADIRTDIPRIARLVRCFHHEMPAHVETAPTGFDVFAIIRRYAGLLRQGESRMAARLPEFLRLADEAEQAQQALPPVFAHHDLLPANFIDDGQRLWLIDFEYSGFGSPVFDLAFLSIMADMTGDQAEMLLRAYLGHPPDDAFRRAHAAMQIAALVREAMWSMVSALHLKAPGVDYAAYARETLDALDRTLVERRSAAF